MITLLGLLGGLLFAFAAVPSALATFRAGKSIGVPANMAWLILGGVLALFAYLTALHGFDAVLALTYGVEGASWATILRYHYLPRASA